MSKWTGKSQGNSLGYRIFIYFIKLFGLKGAYLLNDFVSFYFFLFVGEKKQIIMEFYQQHLNMTADEAKSTARLNFNLLGQSIVDKIALLLGKGDRIAYTEEGEDELVELVSQNKGAILISGHLGNWDVAGNLLKKLDAKVSVVMYQNESESIAKLMESFGSVPEFQIIAIENDLSHLVKIYSAIKQGHLVCIHADRYLANTPTIVLPFLNGEANFPVGPFQLIEKLRVPYSFVFATKCDKFNYHFTATKPKYSSEKAEQIAADFVSLFGEKVSENAAQWFNYYRFHNEIRG